MTATEHTTWQCDMCDRKTDRLRNQGAPLAWIGVTLHKTATHADSSRRLHVCDDCMKQPGLAHLIAATRGVYS